MSMGPEVKWQLKIALLLIPLLRIFKPVGLLIFHSIIAAIVLFSPSLATGILIFVVGTVYGFAKAYFWSTMMGIAGERFPKGGALTINMITAAGMIRMSKRHYTQNM